MTPKKEETEFKVQKFHAAKNTSCQTMTLISLCCQKKRASTKEEEKKENKKESFSSFIFFLNCLELLFCANFEVPKQFQKLKCMFRSSKVQATEKYLNSL